MRLGYVLRHPAVQRLALTHLVEHEVEPRNQDWFARCRINHCLAFPLALFDAARFGLIAIAALVFLPLAYPLIALAAGTLVVAMQMAFDRRHRHKIGTHVERIRLLSVIALCRSVAWAVVIAGTARLAPPPLTMPFLTAFAFLMLFDALSMVALPWVAMAIAAIEGAAFIAACLGIGGPAGLATAAITLGALVYIHWVVFNLHYMFATRRLRTRELRDKNETIQLLLNQYDEEGSDWLYECDRNGCIVNPSQRFCAAAGLSADNLTGKRISDFILDPQIRGRFRKRAWGTEPIRDEVVPLEFYGKKCWWSITGRPIFDAQGTKIGRRGFIADVTKSQLAEQRADYVAHYDGLTGLPNRSLFGTTLERAFVRRDPAQLMALLYIDLDFFKAVNDTYGHQAGDELLVEAARRIERAIPHHAMAARLGGDEFTVLLEQVQDRTTVLKIAETIVRSMDDPISIDDQIMQVGASVGIAFAPDNGIDAKTVLQAADLALYDAKSKGRRGASLFDPVMQAEAHDRRRLELDLRAALTRKEFEVHYQPLIGVETGAIEGYEALLRWNHPTRGSVSPSTFIPIAEDTGQIVPIGEWVLREATMEAACWPDHLFVSINLSPVQLRDRGLVSILVNALANSGLPASRLEIEITETTLMNDSEENLALLHKIRKLGAKIALDDFGTGYSSLNYLRSFPFDKIKIDRCFVSDVVDKEDSQAIVAAVIDLARQLSMRTTAEGVEREDQLDLLRASGCNQVQGFLYSQAVPAEALERVRQRADGQTASAIDLAMLGGDLNSSEQSSPSKRIA